MKIRCEENSIRLRLRKSETAALRSTGTVRTSLTLSQETVFTWAITVEPSATMPRVDWENDQLTVLLPEKTAHDWIDTDKVGIEFRQETTADTILNVLIEKDFPCKDRPDEPKEDFFQNLSTTDKGVC